MFNRNYSSWKFVILSLILLIYPNIVHAIENYGSGNYGSGLYGIAECGNGVCESTESCSSCSADCGSCPSGAPAAAAGGGGGGGVAGLILYRWECTDWSECTPEGIQTRVCTNTGASPDGFGKPAESRQCNYTEPTEKAEIPKVSEAEAKTTRRITRAVPEKIKEAKKAPEVESITGRIVRFTEGIATGPQLFVGSMAIAAITITIIILKIELKGFFKK